MSKDNSQSQNHEPSSLDRFLASKYEPRDHLESTKQFIGTIGANAGHGLADAASRSGTWIKEQVHSGLQDFVSRFLYGEPAHAHPEKTQEPERDVGRDR